MTFPNDQVTEGALSRITSNAQCAADRLNEALTAAKRVRDYAKAAQTRPLRDSDLNGIKAESLSMASALFFAREHGDIVTNAVIKIDKHREGRS